MSTKQKREHYNNGVKDAHRRNYVTCEQNFTPDTS